jgi:hypothetical protein
MFVVGLCNPTPPNVTMDLEGGNQMEKPTKLSTQEALALYPQATKKYLRSPYCLAPSYDTLWNFEGTLWVTETSPDYGVTTSKWDSVQNSWNCDVAPMI